MNDYLLEVKIKNGKIWSCMQETGIKNLSELAKKSGVSYQALVQYSNFKKSPLGKRVLWRAPALQLAEFFGVNPEELFSEDIQNFSIESNKRDYFISHEEVVALADSQQSLIPSPESLCEQELRRNVIASVIKELTPREQRVLRMRFYEDMTLEATREALGVSRERVRQIEAKAIRKLRHPDRVSKYFYASDDDEFIDHQEWWMKRHEEAK
jgi:transcriptional regulator with XRE-family HTH domain